MSATTITPARAPEATPAQTPLSEPSMEDILASIRKIIAEDQSNALGRSGLTGLTRRVAPPAAEPGPAPAVAQHDEVFQDYADQTLPPVASAALDDHAPQDVALQAFEMEAATDRSHGDEHGFGAHEELAAFEAQPLAIETAFPSPLSEQEADPLVSPAAGASVSSSFQTLAESVMLQDPDLVERVLRDSMRPLLKTWLDDHLPSIVERLVRAEIERVARGGRGRTL